MIGESIKYYRQHRRAVDALMASGRLPRRISAPQEDIRTFVRTSQELRELEKRTEAFNLYVALGVGESEIRHSRLLAWLLNPQGSHGLGSKYLKSFLNLVCAEDGDDLAGYNLDLGEFEVECESEQIDVLLTHRTGRFICAIENKVRIDQGERQLEIYRRKIESTHPDWNCKFVFLTLKGEKPADPSYIPVPYDRLLQAVIGAASPFPQGYEEEARTLLFENYSEVIRSEGKPGKLNLLDVLHLTRHELKHSHFLAWLLDPLGSHGLKDAFARYLLSLLERKGLKPKKLSAELTMGDAVVRREREDIDILLISERHRLVLAIENKFAATESAGQLESYYEFLRRHYAGDHLVHVFLDMKGRSPSHREYLPVSYKDLLPFFDSQIKKSPSVRSLESVIRTYVQHYAALLQDHLWIKRKTRWFVPGSIQTCCEKIVARNGVEVGGMLAEVTTWQKSLGRGLEEFLYETVDRFFGTCFRFTCDVWFCFIPPVLDQMPILREGGADPALPGRMVLYQFFVVPFGDSVSVRRPGIFIDVKLLPAKTEFLGFKQQLHDAALANHLFNRVRNSAKLARNDILLNHEICSFEEALTCDDAELRRRITNRVERFSKSIHPQIVAFLRKELAECRYKPTPLKGKGPKERLASACKPAVQTSREPV